MRIPVSVYGFLVAGSVALAGQAAVPPEARKHIEAARVAAGAEHATLWKSVCDGALALAQPPPPRERAANGPPPPVPPRDTWYAEPRKVFDNLYFVGMTEYSAWAITTSQGIIVLDAIFDYSVEAEIGDGLRKLGLNPADIKYVIVSHGHGDHAAGAKHLQEKYGARLVMSAADYDLLDRLNPSWKPKRDVVAADGQRITLGDTTITLYLTPGHTEGTISTIFTVRDGAQPHVVVTWGGTAFNFGPIRSRLVAYQQSAARFRDIASKANADVILSNHTDFDGSTTKLPALAARTPGQPHPYVVGPQVVQRYLTTVDECAQAAIDIVGPA